MDPLPEEKDQLLISLLSHLSTLQSNSQSSTSGSTSATTPLDPDLLLRATRSLDHSTPTKSLWKILTQGEALLQSPNLNLPSPRPLTRLLERTISLLPFDDLKTSISTDKLIYGLNSNVTDIQLLCLAYLSKAAERPSGAAFVANDSELVRCLITTFLNVESTEVAERAGETILAVLEVDFEGAVTVVVPGDGLSGMGEVKGLGLMWRRVFLDQEVYRLFFEWSSLAEGRGKWDLTTKKGRHAASLSQGRLFDFVAGVVRLDWRVVGTSVYGEVEREFYYSKYDSTTGGRRVEGDEGAYGGLLKYVAMGMIDPSDYLMEVLRRDFFLKLLHVVEEENEKGVSSGLRRAIQDGAGVRQEEQLSTNGMHL